MEIIGITRFSVVTESHRRGYAKTRRATLEDSLRTILAPARLQQRIALLEHLPLASLAAQSDQEFRLKILFSEAIPRQFREHLDQISAQHEFVDPVEVALNDDVKARCSELVARQQPAVTFRLDDDDAVNVRHIADLRHMAASAADGDVLSNPHGIYLQVRRGRLEYQEKTYVNHAYGLGLYSVSGKTIFDAGSHRDIDKAGLVQGGRKHAWIRTIHADSDSGSIFDAGQRSVPVTLGDLPEFGPIDFQAVEKHLSPARTAGLRQRLRSLTRSN